MRGKAPAQTLTGSASRITPACAGKRATPSGFRRPRRDHPRVCGEKCLTSWQMVNPLGSPPRVRGKAEPLAVDGDITGITPACAGKRKACVPLMSRDRDHPRVCGEKAAYLRAVWVPKGSPPRVRGKVSHAVTAHLLPGITPACAGKRRIVPGIPVRGWDHPRVCGEKYARNGILFTLRGSPPRVRGKVCMTTLWTSQNGITPACAGKSRQ